MLLLIVSSIFESYKLLIIIYILLSFAAAMGFSRIYNFSLFYVLRAIVEPFLYCFRKVIPVVAGIDFSPIAAMLTLQLVQSIVLQLLRAYS